MRVSVDRPPRTGGDLASQLAGGRRWEASAARTKEGSMDAIGSLVGMSRKNLREIDPRSVRRMLSPKEIGHIFFVWGAYLDPMHFQLPLNLARIMAQNLVNKYLDSLLILHPACLIGAGWAGQALAAALGNHFDAQVVFSGGDDELNLLQNPEAPPLAIAVAAILREADPAIPALFRSAARQGIVLLPYLAVVQNQTGSAVLEVADCPYPGDVYPVNIMALAGPAIEPILTGAC